MEAIIPEEVPKYAPDGDFQKTSEMNPIVVQNEPDPQMKVDTSENVRLLNSEHELHLIANSFLSREKFPEKALGIVDKIDAVRKQRWNGLEDGKQIPSLSESIVKALSESVAEQYPGTQYSIDDGFLSLNGFEWITKDMAIDEYNRLVSLRNTGVDVVTQIHQLSDWVNDELMANRKTLAESVYLSHATISTDRILDAGALASREESNVQAGTYTNLLKKVGQEMSQISMHADQVGMRYGSRGSLEGMRGAFFFPSLPILLREDVSFFSADGLHIFSDGGTSFDIRDAILVTTEKDYDRALRGATTSYPQFYGVPRREDTHKEVLTEQGKEMMEKTILRDEQGQPVFVKTEDFEKSQSKMPPEVLSLVSEKIAKSKPEDIERLREHSFIVPTGEFGDGPGMNTKLFKRRIVFE